MMGKSDTKESSRRRRSSSRERISSHKKHKRHARSSSNDSGSSERKHKSRSKASRRQRSSSVSSSSDSSRERSYKKKHSKHKSKKKKKSKDKDESRLLTAEEYDLMKEENRRKKEEMKKYETPEEKRARRLQKKEQKERKRKAKMGWDEEYMGYTNADNPFGDEHLLQTFVWNKKLQKEGLADAERHDIDKMQQRKMIENKLELEKVKRRRLEREREREERENEREMLQRQKEAEYYMAWEKQEDTFHLHQARLRSKIRIEDGRAKPIDLLAWYIGAEDDDDVTIEMHEPYTYLNGLTINDLEDLLEDIKVYMEMEKEEKNKDFWRDITTITEEELSKLKKIDPSTRDYIGERRTGINQSVTQDVASVFKGKTLQQLSILQKSIQDKLRGGEGVDVGYWESLLGQLKAHMATSRLREKHQEQLRRKLFKLKQQQGIEESTPLFPIVKHGDKGRNSPKPLLDSKKVVDSDQSESRSNTPVTQEAVIKEEAVAGTSGTSVPPVQEESEGASESEDEIELEDTDPDFQSHTDYQAGSYSPRLLQPSELEPDTLVYDPSDDMKRLEFARVQVLRTGQAKKDADDELLKIAKAGMNEEEASFSVMVPLEKQTMVWSDKYRPRKPRFFNRVHTGFEWNKYNQTHYDMDNPPPKIVQGYKFNIFYPDLIDKSKAPSYTITPIEGEADFAVLRFVAGPPYEDIAFKIVNREWEYSYKRGFRCQFQNNIFQLWFHFKRFRYRR